MIAGLLQLAAFAGTAWLLSLAVDRCYRRNDPHHDPGVAAPARSDSNPVGPKRQLQAVGGRS